MERLQKVLAAAGVASRRKCEEYIAAGRVMVNGEVVKEAGIKVNPLEDTIQIDGRVIKSEKKIYLLLHKPKGVITSANDPEGRKVVADYLQGIKERVYPVGRLDYDTEGLLILTNDGEFANLLTHPRHHVPRTYRATVNGVIHGSVLEQLARGVQLEDGMTAPAIVDYHDVNPEKNETVISITIFEGRNRQVRRMFEAVNHPLSRLKRVSFGPILLGNLPRGVYRQLEEREVEELRRAALSADSSQAQPSATENEDNGFGGLSGAFVRPEGGAKKVKPTFKPKPKPKHLANKQGDREKEATQASLNAIGEKKMKSTTSPATKSGKPGSSSSRRTGKAAYSNKGEQSGAQTRETRTERSDRTERADRPTRTGRPDRSARTVGGTSSFAGKGSSSSSSPSERSGKQGGRSAAKPAAKATARPAAKAGRAQGNSSARGRAGSPSSGKTFTRGKRK